MAAVGLVHLLLFTSPIIIAWADPEFVSEAGDKTASIGRSVLFDCEIRNAARKDINWHFMSHGIQISQNQHLLTADTRYSIEEAFTASDVRGYSLHISNVSGDVAGEYKCQLEDTRFLQVHTLIVDNTPVIPVPDILPPVNFTDCCVRLGVSADCLPACHPSSVDLDTFDAEEKCAMDLWNLVKCGTDGRNHESCCHNRFVPTDCLGFCVNSQPAPGADIGMCIDYATEIVECMEEGQYLLPAPPAEVYGEGASPNTIQLKWSPPAENDAQGFRVMYKHHSVATYTSSRQLGADTYTYVIENLKPSEKYQVYVIAVNHYGASLPSYIMTIATPSNILPPGVTETSLSECCVRREVSEECRPYLCGGQPDRFYQDVMFSCYREADNIQFCLQGEMNHTDCCQERSIPSECLKLCSGAILSLGFEDAHCLDSMPTISLCFQENSRNLPSSPRNVRLRYVEDSTAILHWERPLTNPDNIAYYNVKYQKYGSSSYTNHFTRGLSATLDGLESSTTYRVSVSAMSHTGSSLPSNDIVFTTYAPGGDIIWGESTVPGPTQLPPVLNMTSCCIENGVTASCLSLCQYGQQFDTSNIIQALACIDQIPLMLKCGADGRNHTGCCESRRVDPDCLPLCAVDDNMLDTFDLNAHILCALEVTDITECYEEGVESIPGVPRSVTSVNMTTHTLTVDWRPPASIPKPLSGYKIHYRETFDPKKANIAYSLSTNSHVILQDLEPNTMYSLWVVAYNKNGESLASDEVTVQTLPEISSLPTYNFSMPLDLTDCCKRWGVSLDCLPACDGSAVVSLDTCGQDLGKLITCAADGKNHKPCCRNNWIPENCIHFCEGNPQASTWDELLCLSYTEQMLSCFREGFDGLPTAPTNFRSDGFSSNSITLTWGPPQKNAEGVKYMLYYKMSSQAAYTLLNSSAITSPYTLRNLRAFGSYMIYVVAVNRYGASLPSVILTVWTDSRTEPEVEIYQKPGGMVKLTEPVGLGCIARGVPTPNVTWSKNRVPVHFADQNERSLYFPSVDKDDAGMYTCMAKNRIGDGDAASVELRVQYAPEVTVPNRNVMADIGQGQTAHLRCNFKGYPDTIVWKKGAEIVPPRDPRDARRFARETFTITPGVLLQSKLSIARLQKSDFGQYSCTGTNSLGQISGYVSLLASGGGGQPVTPFPPFSPAPAVTDIAACCRESGRVPRQCMKACSFDIDLTVVENGATCVPGIPDIIRCGADGKNHTKCCSDNKVPQICWPFCSGVVAELDSQHLMCLSFMDNIVNCLEDGHHNIPGPPQNLRASLVNGYIMLQWHAPSSNADKVSTYDVHYTTFERGRNGDDEMVVVPSQNRTTYLSAIYAYMYYNITVRAANHHGESQDSNKVTLKTNELRPSVPTAFSVHLVGERYIRLKWDHPVTHAGAVLNYIISYYRAVDENATPKLIYVSADQTSYRLENLDANTEYVMYLQARSSHYLSERTKEQRVTTGEFKEAKQSSGVDTTAVALGVFFMFLIIALVIGAALFYYFRIRKRPQRFKDTVAFENPGYATAAEARISGLPGELGPNGRPLDSSIMREDLTDSTPAVAYHNSVYNNGDVANGEVTSGEKDDPPYATLPVDMVEASASMEKVKINFDEPITGEDNS